MRRNSKPLSADELEIVRKNIHDMSYQKIADMINKNRPFYEGLSGATLQKHAIENGILRDKQRRSGVKKKTYESEFFDPYEFAEFYR